MNVKSTNPRPLRGPLPLVALLLSSCLSSFLCPALAQNPSKIQDDLFDQAADYSQRHSGHAVLIQHQGKILYERYDNWGADTPHMLVDGEKTPQAMSTFQGE